MHCVTCIMFNEGVSALSNSQNTELRDRSTQVLQFYYVHFWTNTHGKDSVEYRSVCN